MDEKKIFNDLSTALRKDVSEFLVLDLMGSDSFFMTMSTTLWPRLLPLLSPMTVEANEKLCRQGEECEEMHVIIDGVMTGYTHLEGSDPERDPPKVERRLTKGDSINVLCLLEVWYHCVETVVSGLNTVETYAVKSEEFVALFQSDMDIKNFASMQKREVKKFAFVPLEDAPTNLGRPLYMSCFSTVDLQMVKVVGPMLNTKDFPHSDRLLARVVVDLVDGNTQKPFNEFWSHSTTPAAPQVSADGGFCLFCADKGRVCWTDVSASFKVASLRLRVIVSDPVNGSEHVVPLTLISLHDLYLNTPKAVVGADAPLDYSPPSPRAGGQLVPATFDGGRGCGGRVAPPSRSSSTSALMARADRKRAADGDGRNAAEEGGGRVAVWCEVEKSRTSKTSSSPLPLRRHSDPKAHAAANSVHYGEEWAPPPRSSAVMFYACVKKPERTRRFSKRVPGSSDQSAKRSFSLPPGSDAENPSNTPQAFQGTKSGGERVLLRRSSFVHSFSDVPSRVQAFEQEQEQEQEWKDGVE